MKLQERILVIDDDELIASVLARALANDCGYETRFITETGEVIGAIENWYPDIILLDINLPERDGISILQEIIERGIDTKAVMLTADNTAEMAIKALKIGAADYITKPFNMEEVKIVLQNILEKKRLRDEVDCLRRDRNQAHDHEIVGVSGTFKLILDKAATLARAKVQTILITGESGTGKELLARHVHQLIHHEDPEADHAPFVTVNCTALPEHLFESELFGYVKGAFTDAKTDQKGLFELANGGSILLDEIGDMKEGLQAKLLRVLEERQVRRVGGKADMPVNVTVIATTNRDLGAAVKEGRFRQDLFYRLHTFPITLPPLRERKNSIPMFIDHFLNFFSTKYNKPAIESFSPEAERILCDYPWPGNVRELKNVIERIVVLEQARVIQPEHLPVGLVQLDTAPGKGHSDSSRFTLPEGGVDWEELKKDIYLQALATANNNMIKAAKLLRVTYDSFRNHAKKYSAA